MLKGLKIKKALRKKVEKAIQEHQIAKRFFVCRCTQGLSVAQVAKKMGCTVSRVHKIEGSRDCDLHIDDIVGYAHALGLGIEINLIKAKV